MVELVVLVFATYIAIQGQQYNSDNLNLMQQIIKYYVNTYASKHLKDMITNISFFLGPGGSETSEIFCHKSTCLKEIIVN